LNSRRRSGAAVKNACYSASSPAQVRIASPLLGTQHPVQQPPPPRAHRQYPNRRSRGALPCQNRQSGRDRLTPTKSPREMSERFKESAVLLAAVKERRFGQRVDRTIRDGRFASWPGLRARSEGRMAALGRTKLCPRTNEQIAIRPDALIQSSHHRETGADPAFTSASRSMCEVYANS
jgi:hypothetical protein